MTDQPPSAATTAAADREALGRIVRDTWVAWAREQPDPKPSWLVGWDELDDDQREVDMRIGEALAAALPHLTPPPPDSDRTNTMHHRLGCEYDKLHASLMVLRAEVRAVSGE